MKPFTFATQICIFICYIVCGLLQAQKSKTVEVIERPNIIFILTDDQRWDALGYAGNKLIHTRKWTNWLGGYLF